MINVNFIEINSRKLSELKILMKQRKKELIAKNETFAQQRYAHFECLMCRIIRHTLKIFIVSI